MTISVLVSGIILISYIGGACKKDGLPTLQPLSQEIPAGFPAPRYTFSDNPLTVEGFELGRRLFYDGRLSVDGQHPCSSCHQQIAGFGTFEHDRSHGVNNTHTLRNAPVLFNLAWNSSFHWDGKYASLKEEAVQPITGHHEMGETFNNVIRKLESDAAYKYLFKKVFHSDKILPTHIQSSLSQFTGFMVSANSRYDKFKRSEISFTAQEEAGYLLYQANCASCHPEPLFTDHSFRNIGLPLDPFLNDIGRMQVTGKEEDSLKFKVPTLRNVYISSNYMHDGRFNTLAQCINHYRTGVQQGPTLDPLLQNGINLTTTEVAALAVFMRTLTDSSFLTDTRFSQPQ